MYAVKYIMQTTDLLATVARHDVLASLVEVK